MKNSNNISIEYKGVKQMISNGELEIIGGNASNLFPQAQLSISRDGNCVYFWSIQQGRQFKIAQRPLQTSVNVYDENMIVIASGSFRSKELAKRFAENKIAELGVNSNAYYRLS